MTENETYFIPFFVGIITLILSSYIPRYGYKRWEKWGCALGCLLQPIVWFVLTMLIITPISLVKGCEQEQGTMLCIRNIEEDRDCRYEEIWYLKTDGSISYHYDKGSNDHKTEPCGNDTYWENLDVFFDHVDSVPMLKFYHIGDIKVYLDLKNRKAFSTFNNDTIEVVSADWDAIEKYFNLK